MATLIIAAFAQLLGTAPAVHGRHDHLLKAIRIVESNDREGAVGDGGKAIGPYQIHRRYWKDAGVPGRYEDCHKRAYSERVIRAYWRRYCPDALAKGDQQTLARIHHGGPRGHQKAATRKYWQKVRAELANRRQ